MEIELTKVPPTPKRYYSKRFMTEAQVQQLQNWLFERGYLDIAIREINGFTEVVAST